MGGAVDLLERDRTLRLTGIVVGPPPHANTAVRAAVAALECLERRDAAFEAKHRRGPDGEFVKMFDRIVAALKKHREGNGAGDPFEGFDREQLRRVARQRGITLRRNAPRDEIAKALVDHLESEAPAKVAKKPSPSPKRPVATPSTGPAATLEKLRGMSTVDASDVLDDMSRADVYALAQHLGIEGQSKARKRDLVDLVLARHGQAHESTPTPPLSAVGGGSTPPRGALDRHIDELTSRLRDIADEAAPIAAEVARRLESTKVYTDQVEFHRRRRRLLDLGREGDELAHELLAALIARDGSPWGGDPDTDADRWQTSAPGSLRPNSELDSATFGQLRDRYVIADRNTVIQNASLRSGTPTPTATRWAARMRKMVRSTATKRDTRVYRGGSMRPEDVMRFRPGVVVRDLGLVSTAEARWRAEFFAGERHERLPGTIKTLFEVRVPADTPAAAVGDEEIVLDHGNAFRFVSSRMAEDGTVHVVMELVKDRTG